MYNIIQLLLSDWLNQALSVPEPAPGCSPDEIKYCTLFDLPSKVLHKL